jgi:hypothetical protein
MREYNRPVVWTGQRWKIRFAWSRVRLMQYGHQDQPVSLWLEPYWRLQVQEGGRWRDTCEAIPPGHPYADKLESSLFTGVAASPRKWLHDTMRRVQAQACYRGRGADD